MEGYERWCPSYKVMREWADDGCPGLSYELWIEAEREKTRVSSQRGKYERKKGE